MCSLYIIGIWNGKKKKQLIYTVEKKQLYWEIYEICSNVNMEKTTYFIFLVMTCSETVFLIAKKIFSIFFPLRPFLFLASKVQY